MSVSVPQYVVQGKTSEAVAVVSNKGTMTTSNFEVRFYWSTDTVITTADQNTGVACSFTLTAYGQARCIQQVPAPSGGAGPWYLGALITDPTDSNTANNSDRSGRTTTVTSACATVDTTPISVPATGTSSSITVNALSSCFWSASPQAPAGVQSMITLDPPSGSGTTKVFYTVYPNLKNVARTGYLNIGGNLVPVVQQANTSDVVTRYIQLLYFSFFGRMPSQQEINGHAADAQTPAARIALANAFLYSDEFFNAGRYVAGLYVGLLGRDPEYAGWLYQRNAMLTNIATPQQLVRNFLNSTEYGLKYGSPTDADFVKLLYRNILLREPSDQEVTNQVNALHDPQNPNFGRVDMASAFLLSPEFRLKSGPRLMAFNIAAGLYGRDPQDGERMAMMDELANTFDTIDLVNVVMTTPEFTGQVE
jgi:hypothetical protein